MYMNEHVKRPGPEQSKRKPGIPNELAGKRVGDILKNVSNEGYDEQNQDNELTSLREEGYGELADFFEEHPESIVRVYQDPKRAMTRLDVNREVYAEKIEQEAQEAEKEYGELRDIVKRTLNFDFPPVEEIRETYRQLSEKTIRQEDEWQEDLSITLSEREASRIIMRFGTLAEKIGAIEHTRRIIKQHQEKEAEKEAS